MNINNDHIAACGLDCSQCEIFKADNDPEIAQGVADWFKKEKNIDIEVADIHCDGCRGKRIEHWSPDCWILKCCVDEKKLENCSSCDEFPCEKLVQWSQETKDYGKALDRLKEMRVR